jgi:hypothetical protein
MLWFECGLYTSKDSMLGTCSGLQGGGVGGGDIFKRWGLVCGP